MEDLTGKIPGSQLTAAEWNQLPGEVQNVITNAGIGLSNADIRQLAKAITLTVGSGTHYIDSGAANAYVLSLVSTLEPPTQLIDGMRISFLPLNTNTGGSTVNVQGLGVKPLLTAAGNPVLSGSLQSGQLVQAHYNLSTDSFRVISILSNAFTVFKSGDQNSVGPGLVNDTDLVVTIEAGVKYKIEATIMYEEVIAPGGGAFEINAIFPTSEGNTIMQVAANTTYTDGRIVANTRTTALNNWGPSGLEVGRSITENTFSFTEIYQGAGANGTWTPRYSSGSGGETRIIAGSRLTITPLS